MARGPGISINAKVHRINPAGFPDPEACSVCGSPKVLYKCMHKGFCKGHQAEASIAADGINKVKFARGLNCHFERKVRTQRTTLEGGLLHTWSRRTY
jgi:hypothetical protein